MLNIRDLLSRFSIDSSRLFYIDETGMSVDRDCPGAPEKKAIFPYEFRS